MSSNQDLNGVKIVYRSRLNKTIVIYNRLSLFNNILYFPFCNDGIHKMYNINKELNNMASYCESKHSFVHKDLISTQKVYYEKIKRIAKR